MPLTVIIAAANTVSRVSGDRDRNGDPAGSSTRSATVTACRTAANTAPTVTITTPIPSTGCPTSRPPDETSTSAAAFGITDGHNLIAARATRVMNSTVPGPRACIQCKCRDRSRFAPESEPVPVHAPRSRYQSDPASYVRPMKMRRPARTGGTSELRDTRSRTHRCSPSPRAAPLVARRGGTAGAREGFRHSSGSHHW